MFQTMKKRMKNEKGLTLIELLAVIVILAVIAAIAIPAIGNIITNSKYNAVKSDALNILNAAQLHKMDEGGNKGVPIATFNEGKVTDGKGANTLKDKGYLETVGAFTSGTVNTEGAELKLSGTAVVDGVSIEFKDATIQAINNDKQKGKDILKEGVNPTVPAGS
ncbi:prepilin-type N-terminal cleavage/methylation domain-containing protein [Savagea sp. SN6]|uniref:Prepilin-type N-terminal cleavage/methylation domain-containing protein n=1 Tax=Savagea serpentis TaxID=2785297 RepID=A0A8J7KE50_9BACL|nr:prepilin-type N-terminal cleavage/methylation domain-containing protein [Savagea serpentis]MBF4500831.1 prepilin-type N-terminal cleavage/methylation domain-containing protein [Savagea serpentis]